MKLATSLRSLAATAVFALALALPAHAAPITGEPVSGNFGDIYATPDGVNLKGGGGTINVLTTIYDNTASAANFGFSSTDFASVWGDELLTAASGVLSTNKFTIFNSGSSAGPLLTATVGVSFFDAITSAPLGGYSTNINFGAGLAPGFFSIITVTGLDPLLINIGSDIIVTQTVTAKTGTASRLGIASLNPPTVGASPPTMYINSSTVGPAGFYTISAGPANPGYQLVSDVVPTPTHSTTWGRVKHLYR